MQQAAKLLLAAGFAAGSFLAAPAYAQLQFGRMDTGLYLGGSAGGSKFDKACDGNVAGVSCDDTDFAWKGFVGYDFTRNFGLELGYADLGKATASVPGLSTDFKVKGVDLVGVASLPITQQFSLYGKLGVAWTKTRISIPIIPGLSTSDRTTNVTFGAGARYNFTRNFAGRLEWQRYQDVGGDNTGKDNVDYFSAGLLYNFN